MIIRLINKESVINSKKFGQINSAPISEELYNRLIMESESYEDMFEILDDSPEEEDKD